MPIEMIDEFDQGTQIKVIGVGGGGGNAVKHGDLDESLLFPSENLDVHMGRHDFLCTDCHTTDDHLVSGRMLSVSVDDENQVACTDCHAADLSLIHI